MKKCQLSIFFSFLLLCLFADLSRNCIVVKNVSIQNAICGMAEGLPFFLLFYQPVCLNSKLHQESTVKGYISNTNIDNKT